MDNLLPAVSISSFVYINKYASPLPKEYSLSENYLSTVENKYVAPSVPKKISTINYLSAPSLRVVALSLYNNTSETIILKKNLQILEKDLPGTKVDFRPLPLNNKQAVSVYFMYNLLQQRLYQLSRLEIAEPCDWLSSINYDITSKPNQNIFFTSTQKLDVHGKLKEANLFYKSIEPGQTLSGLLLFLTASAASLQFNLTY